MPRERWEEVVKIEKGRLRSLLAEVNLDLVFSLHYERTVKKDGTFSFNVKIYRLRHLANTKLTMGIIPNQKLLVIKGQRAADYLL